MFNYILSAEQPVNLELPNQWLWEIIDEFIYQFQAFSQFRSKLGKKTDEEIEILKSNPKVIEHKSITYQFFIKFWTFPSPPSHLIHRTR